MTSKRLNRKLTAILYADVAGYSRLTGEDEEATHRTLRAYLDAITGLIEAHKGEIKHFAGDAVLADFGTVVDALACASEIQGELRVRNRDVPENRQVRFRIGINLGDVIVDRGDIYGDGVNVAAQLESLTEPGGICISGMVHDAVGTKLPLTYKFSGEHRVKNIAKPVSVYRVLPQHEPAQAAARHTADAEAPWNAWKIVGVSATVVILIVAAAYVVPRVTDDASREPASIQSSPPAVAAPTPSELTAQDSTAERPEKPSVAILPFENMSGDPEQEYFADGMTEDLITDLSKISGLFVISRSSMFTYKGRKVKVRDVGRELGVRYIVEGSVRKAGDRVRINAQLIDAESGFHVWADRFDRDMEDIFSLQDEVLEKITSALEVQLTPRERDTVKSRYTNSLEAYDQFLRGAQHLWTFAPDSQSLARDFYERAIQIDPSFALAYVHLARTYTSAFVDGWSEDAADALQRAYQLTEKAAAIDDSIPQVHWMLALLQMYRKEYTKAVESAERAIALDPNYGDGYSLLTRILNFGGTPESGLEPMEKAMRLNPRAFAGYLHAAGEAYYTLGRYDDAAEAFEKALERNPTFQRAHMWLAASYAQAGLMDEAGWEVDEVLTLAPDFSVARVAPGLPFKNPAHLEHVLDGLRRAGLPE